MAVYTNDIIIERPVAEVWAFMTDLTNAPIWDTGILAGRQISISAGPMGVGATIEATRALMGRSENSGDLENVKRSLETPMTVGQPRT